MSHLLSQIVVAKACAEDVAPGIEFPVCPVIALLQFFRREAHGLVNHRARVILAPVVGGDAAVTLHLLEQPRPGVGCEDVERGRGDAVLDAPVHRPAEHVLVVVVETKQ